MDEFELPEVHQQLQQQQFNSIMQHSHEQQSAYDTCFGSPPVLDEFLQQLLPHDTPLEDRQCWYEFLDASIGEDKSVHDFDSNSNSNTNNIHSHSYASMPQFFDGLPVEDDRLWWGGVIGMGMGATDMLGGGP